MTEQKAGTINCASFITANSNESKNLQLRFPEKSYKQGITNDIFNIVYSNISHLCRHTNYEFIPFYE